MTDASASAPELLPETYFLPAARSSPEELEEVRTLARSSGARSLFEDYPVATVVLDPTRRIAWANRSALGIFGLSLEEAYGLRPGEAIGCLRSCEAPGGCGTGPFCSLCGFARTLEYAIGEDASSGDCTLTRARGGVEESLDLLVWARPLEGGGGRAFLASIRDVSDQKRREVLERIFYHDIANTAAGIAGIANVARPGPDEEDRRYYALLRAAANQLAEEIASQRELKAAEAGELPLNAAVVEGLAALEGAVAFFEYALFGTTVSIAVDPASVKVVLETDPAILKRILVNMIKNALEAAEKGERISVRCSRLPGGPGLPGPRALFAVRNAAVMPEEAQKLVFRRSFSTKGAGRGVGTYGMKLLAERYLKGRVRFESREGEGTTFFLELPTEIPG